MNTDLQYSGQVFYMVGATRAYEHSWVVEAGVAIMYWCSVRGRELPGASLEFVAEREFTSRNYSQCGDFDAKVHRSPADTAVEHFNKLGKRQWT